MAPSATADPQADYDTRINPRNLWYVAAALAVLIAAVESDNHFFLNFLHVITGLLWTGVDLFMGFMVSPILRRVEMPARRAIVTRLAPRMLFMMPTVSIVATTSGFYLAEGGGHFDLPWPGFGWVVASLVVVAILTVQGLCMLTPINVMVYLELRNETPDMDRVSRLMRIYFRLTASQGVMQVAIIVIMARFVTGI